MLSQVIKKNIIVIAIFCIFFVVSYRIFCRVLRDSTTRFVGLSVHPSVRPSVRHTLLFLGFCGFWHHCSCPNDGVTSIIAPAHPHATEVAVYPALLAVTQPVKWYSLSFLHSCWEFQPRHTLDEMNHELLLLTEGLFLRTEITPSDKQIRRLHQHNRFPDDPLMVCSSSIGELQDESPLTRR